MITVQRVKQNSLASAYGILPGEELLQINSNPVRDIIDFLFYSQDENLALRLRDKKGRIRRVGVTRKMDQTLGLTFHQDRVKGCPNRCIFCFVEQLPKGLRKPLYFKDEDFRFSFLKGNFITLTNTSRDDIQRIIRQRLSPLYISVHTVEEKLRKRMLGNPKIPDILPSLRKLVKGKIVIHTQIVLCPGINDGRHLRKSIRVLSGFYPYVNSIAIVPVGLTRFRKNLFPLKPVGKSLAQETLKISQEFQKEFQRRLGRNLVYLSDEFFLLAGLDIPKASYYDDFAQIENGVGLLRKFLDDFKRDKEKLPLVLDKKLGLTLVTGKLAFNHMKRIEDHLKKTRNLKVNVITVKNDFLGESITVSGLLAGRDIILALKNRKNLGEIVILPPSCVNHQGKFLDELKVKDVEEQIKRKVILGSYNLVDTALEAIKYGLPRHS